MNTPESKNRTFAATWDYRCPFARNAHTAILAALDEGAGWTVRFMAFSLDQVHVPEGEPPVWERPPDERGSGVLPLQWGIVVRDRHPDAFPSFHRGVFAARFEQGLKIGKDEVLSDVAAAAGLDPEVVTKEIDEGWPLEVLAAEHTEAVDQWAAFGVPTLVVDDEAVFIRLMEPDRPDDLVQALDLLPSTRLNEFKRTRIPR